MQEVWDSYVIDDLVGPTHEARAVWEFVGSLDLSGYYEKIRAVQGVAGRKPHDPQVVLSLWIYAYSKGVSSARELGRLTESAPAYRWLCGCKAVNYHTLSDFRTAHGERLRELFTEILGVLSAEGLLSLERVMHDGTKVKAFSSGDRFRRGETLELHLEQAREQVKAMEEEGEEGEPVSLRVKRRRERAAKEKMKRLESAQEELKKIQAGKAKSERPKARVSESDPECRIMKHGGGGGYAASYNVQVSTDGDNGAVVGVGVTQSPVDYGELEPSVDRIEEQTRETPDEMVVDAGFMSRETVMNMKEREVGLTGPLGEGRQQRIGQLKRRGVSPEFYTKAFEYDEERDVFVCPAGERLTLDGREKRPGVVNLLYRCPASVCQGCGFKERCCPGNEKKGRSVRRSVEDPVVKAHREKMKTEGAKQLYKKRGPIAEFTNAWLKAKIGLRQFRLQGLEKVTMEAMWACLTYNVQLWIRLCWRPALSCESG
jgi:transposase